MDLTLDIPDELLAEARAIAAKEKRSLDELIEEGLKGILLDRYELKQPPDSDRK
ncbi:hypothetical protein [Aestuariivirga sp.]|uniref:hypothetical protein n=1 Tax=Aestuariivirga sp. TaxID=2650926 RepID=UPI0039E5B479